MIDLPQKVYRLKGGRLTKLTAKELAAEARLDAQCELGVRVLTLPLSFTLAEVERRYVLAVLDACAGNKTLAADLLGISRRGIYHLLKRAKEKA